MNLRERILDLAASGQRMPIGTDLVLHEHHDAASIVRDGVRLGRVVEEAAHRYNTPLAMPLMDLRLEKADLLVRLGVPDEEAEAFHFSEPLSAESVQSVSGDQDPPSPARSIAQAGSVRYIATQTSLIPVGMAIGPFSLATKLLADPITPVAMSGMGLAGTNEPAVRLAEQCLAISEAAVARSVRAQAEAGAQALMICEPPRSSCD